jgi:hypothetical protein
MDRYVWEGTASCIVSRVVKGYSSMNNIFLYPHAAFAKRELSPSYLSFPAGERG